MRRHRSHLSWGLMVMFFGALPIHLSAEVYLCDGRYTNKPCESESAPVVLPPLSRGGTLALPSLTANDGGGVPGASKVQVSECRPDPRGYALRIVSSKITQHYSPTGPTRYEASEPELIVRIRNDGEDYAAVPITLKVSDAHSGRFFTVPVSEGLAPKGETNFSVSLEQLETQLYKLQLLYAPARSCPIETVRLDSREITTTDQQGVVDILHFEEHTIDLVRAIESEAKKLHPRAARATRQDQSYMVEVRKLDARLVRACGDQAKRESARIMSACQRAARAIQGATPNN